MHNKKKYASLPQIQQLYKVPRKTLMHHINDLKNQGIVIGVRIQDDTERSKSSFKEVFDLNEVITIGLRLGNKTAIWLHRYETGLMTEKIQTLTEQKRMLELELSHLWNLLDTEDLEQ